MLGVLLHCRLLLIGIELAVAILIEHLQQLLLHLRIHHSAGTTAARSSRAAGSATHAHAAFRPCPFAACIAAWPAAREDRVRPLPLASNFCITCCRICGFIIIPLPGPPRPPGPPWPPWPTRTSRSSAHPHAATTHLLHGLLRGLHFVGIELTVAISVKALQHLLLHLRIHPARPLGVSQARGYPQGKHRNDYHANGS